MLRPAEPPQTVRRFFSREDAECGEAACVPPRLSTPTPSRQTHDTHVGITSTPFPSPPVGKNRQMCREKPSGFPEKNRYVPRASHSSSAAWKESKVLAQILLFFTTGIEILPQSTRVHEGYKKNRQGFPRMTPAMHSGDSCNHHGDCSSWSCRLAMVALASLVASHLFVPVLFEQRVRPLLLLSKKATKKGQSHPR